jgi:hypothetical protein
VRRRAKEISKAKRRQGVFHAVSHRSFPLWKFRNHMPKDACFNDEDSWDMKKKRRRRDVRDGALR